IDRVSRDGRDKQIEWFETNFKIDKISKNFEKWPQLMEICERRNLFAHTNGYVSDQYLDGGRKHGYQLERSEV
ncbi:MAG: hypothetical protein NTU78_11845, partial [Alphaproteobacteria bacterium]|nr:hypothetical protein [Alphaproteobacteria bacterium]